MEANAEFENLKKRMELFPCAFNLIGTDKVTTAKLRSVQHNLESELEIDDGCKNELIIKRNLLTWTLFRLEKKDDALQLNRDIVELTDRTNFASLANGCFVMWQTGDECGAMKRLKELENMKSDNNFQTLFTDAQAEQAYYYSRLGGPSNLQRAADLFSALPKNPVNYLRRFGLGLVYRRMTHMNIVCSSSEHLTVEDYQKKAADCLFEVAENAADRRLRSLAYAQLANLRRNYPRYLCSGDKAMFRGLSVEKLCDKAIDHGKTIPSVLLQCGKAMKPINTEKAIDWLRTSVAVRANSTAYHHLGLCYKRKADKKAKEQQNTPSKSEGLSLHNNVDQQTAGSQNPCQYINMTGTSQDTYRRPADVNTLSQQENIALMYETENDRQRSYPHNGANRSEHSNYLPQHFIGSYGQQGYETPDFQTLSEDISYQPATSDHQYRQTQEQHGGMQDRTPASRYQGSQVYYYVKGELINADQMSELRYGTNVQFSELYAQSVEEPQTLGGVEEQGSYQNVQIDGTPCVHDNAETLGAYGQIHSGTVAGSLIPDMYQGWSWEDQNTVFPPCYADSCYDDPWGLERIKQQVQEYFETVPSGLRYAQRTGYPPGSTQSTFHRGQTQSTFHRGQTQSTFHRGQTQSTFHRGQTQSTRGQHGSVRGTGLGRRNSANTQSMSFEDAYFSEERFEPIASLKSSVRSRRSILTLNIDDEHVQEAKKCFQKAIELAPENLPAILDLGILLKDTNQLEEALIQFNCITNRYNPSMSHRVTVISAYEQAGLCLLELSRAEQNADYKELAKSKLSKAVSIAADLIHILPELQGSHKEVWQAFTTLLAVNDGEQIPDSHRLKRKIKILELAREHRDIIDVIQKLKETGHEELTNPDIVKAALESYLRLEQPDNALVYHNIVAMNPSVKDSDWWNAGSMLSLRVKVLLHAIAGRLKNRDDNPTMLFQQLFDLIFGSCVGLHDPDNDQQTDSMVLGDVLFIFESDDEESNEPTEKSARCLKRLMPCLFGLMAGENMKVNICLLLLKCVGLCDLGVANVTSECRIKSRLQAKWQQTVLRWFRQWYQSFSEQMQTSECNICLESLNSLKCCLWFYSVL